MNYLLSAILTSFIVRWFGLKNLLYNDLMIYRGKADSTFKWKKNFETISHKAFFYQMQYVIAKRKLRAGFEINPTIHYTIYMEWKKYSVEYANPWACISFSLQQLWICLFHTFINGIYSLCFNHWQNIHFAGVEKGIWFQ